MIGTNFEELVRLPGVPIDLPVFWVPHTPLDAAWYRPLEEWPEDFQILFDYNPTLAKQMLADAGYPDGFTLELLTSPDPDELDLSDLIVAQWDKIGVDVKIDVRDAATWMAMLHGRRYKHMAFSTYGQGLAELQLSRQYHSDAYLNWTNYSNPEVDVLIDKMMAEIDVDERMRWGKEAYPIMMREAPYIPIRPGTEGHFWWPWLKNYYGERNVGDFTNPWPILAHIWIDQDLKAEMGF
ncbi:unnamed protein product, partial [marine sediment metagenome]